MSEKKQKSRYSLRSAGICCLFGISVSLKINLRLQRLELLKQRSYRAYPCGTVLFRQRVHKEYHPYR